MNQIRHTRMLATWMHGARPWTDADRARRAAELAAKNPPAKPVDPVAAKQQRMAADIKEREAKLAALQAEVATRKKQAAMVAELRKRESQLAELQAKVASRERRRGIRIAGGVFSLSRSAHEQR